MHVLAISVALRVCLRQNGGFGQSVPTLKRHCQLILNVFHKSLNQFDEILTMCDLEANDQCSAECLPQSYEHVCVS